MTGYSKLLLTASLALLVSGMVSTVNAQQKCDTCMEGQMCQNCKNGQGQCQNGDCHHSRHLIPYWMIPDVFKDEDQIAGVKRWSKEDYYLRGQLPIGQRQKCYKGKIWPVAPRPTGPKPHMIHRFHAAHYWPYPYNIWAQNNVRNMIEVHQQKGWQDATTLYNYHFSADTNELTDAGVLHLKWILQNAPSQYRTLYLQTSEKAGANDLRMAEVAQIASRLTAGQQTPEVVFRNTTPYGRPAQEVDAIRRNALANQPQPRIQSGGGGGQGYGGGGGGS
ncbi:MAG: hypothetical protein HUJ26_13360 [Planctomycetaceae bacterium]|nr:hypothetical protein [Planctomycetaceae bacterium]